MVFVFIQLAEAEEECREFTATSYIQDLKYHLPLLFIINRQARFHGEIQGNAHNALWAVTVFCGKRITNTVGQSFFLVTKSWTLHTKEQIHHLLRRFKSSLILIEHSSQPTVNGNGWCLTILINFGCGSLWFSYLFLWERKNYIRLRELLNLTFGAYFVLRSDHQC